MRKSPLWRPQPDDGLVSSVASDDQSGGSSRLSVMALAGFGLVLAAGVGTVAVMSFQGADMALPVESAIRADVVLTPPKAEQATVSAPANAAVPPSPETIDVAVAQSEFDVARLEELTGMVGAAPLPPAPAVSRDASAMVSPVAVTSELRPVIGESPVTAPSADDEPVPDDEAQTASIQPPTTKLEDPAAQSATIAPETPLPALNAVKVNRHVNMRSGPADEAGVVTVVPSGATVQAQGGCEWCVVTYNGQRGYIYKSFLGGGGASSSGLSGPGLY